MSYIKDKLWINIDTFKIDDEKSVIKFSDKLAKENNWTHAFALRTINEYKRFIYLCCISPTGASPSDIVDKVWHLHLTYTMNYWIEFCPNILGRELHHFPSKGGIAEKEKHSNWYNNTIELYIQTFGEIPPSDIWTIPEKHQLKNGSKQDLNLVYTQNSFGISTNFLPEIIAFSIPFIYLTILYKNPNPFSENGLHFLEFYALFGLCFLLLAIYKTSIFKKKYTTLIKDQIPKDLTVFDLAYLKNGEHNLIQTGIIDLIENNAINHEGKGVFRVTSENAFNTSKKYNPVSKNITIHQKGEVLEYRNFASTSSEYITEIDTKLKSIENKISIENNIKYIPFVLGFIGVSRCIQGYYNNKPIGILIFLIVLFVVIIIIILEKSNKDFVFKEIVEDMYKNSHQDDVTILYGSPLLDRFIWSGYASLIGEYTQNDLHYFFERKVTKKESSCSSCSSGGCGSSCSGGGDGGGCGGCGGGD